MRLTRPIGWSGAAAVIAGAAMGAIVGARVACSLGGWLPGPACAPGGVPTGALVGALLALVALPLRGQGTRRGEHATHRPAPTTTTAARLVWLAIAAALGTLARRGGGEASDGAGGTGVDGAPARCLGRRRWAGDGGPGAAAPAWVGPVGGRGGLLASWGVTALAELVDWILPLGPSRAHGWGPVIAERVAVDLVTAVLFLAIGVGVIVLLMAPATRRDFRSSRQPWAGTNGR